jgi:hypothetical protein
MDDGLRERVGDHAVASQCVEWCPICRTMDVVRESTTPEVREQWQEVQREALLTLGAIVEHYGRRSAND